MSIKHPLFDVPLPKGWEIVKVDDLKAQEPHSCVAGPFGSNISSKYFVPEGVPVIRGSNLRDDLTRFVSKEFVYVSEEQAKKYKAQHVKAEDLVFTCWGTIGQVGLIPTNGPFKQYIISNKQLKFRPDPKKSIPIFLFYYFAGPEMVKHIQSRAIGAAVPGINLGILKSLEVALPPLPAQRKIAAILSAYDDLIENNLRRIKILEEMAQNLYREWFVKFRFPGHEQAKFVDSPLGMIPEGWKVKMLGELADQIRDSVSPNAINPQTPYLGLEHLPRQSITLSEWGAASEVQSTKLSFKQGDILFGKIRPYFHKVGVAPLAGVCSSDTIVIRPRAENSYGVVLSCTSSAAFVEHATATSQGTKMPRANWDILVKYTIPIPPQPLLKQFDDLINSIVKQLNNFIFRNRNLRLTRDLLLPKLISGEVDVSAIDIAVPLEETSA